MWQSWLALHMYVLAVLILGPNSKLVGEAFQPEFAKPLMNLTVPLGRDATFKCYVQNLGGYRVGWVKADTKAIQAIHVHVITNNHRIGVSHNGQTVWNLHIRSVQEEDRGQYMCQINTDPMKSQMGHLDVVVPPDFIPEETSGDVMVPEGGTARVSCRARGTPTPRVMWKREDGHEIVVRDASGFKRKVPSYEHEVLTLSKISRSEMGAYLCIASNGVPPAVSKRVTVRVHFHPVIQVPNQLVGAPLGTDVTLECYVESSPKSINYWVKDSNEMVISSNKYEVVNVPVSLFESRMALTVRGLSADDLGGYRCVAKNSLGEAENVIRLYEIPGPTTKNTVITTKKEDFKYSTAVDGPDSQFGSGDRADDEDDKDAIVETADRHRSGTHRGTHDNTTKNRTHYNLLQNLSRNKVNNVANENAEHNNNNICAPIVVTYYLFINFLLI